VSRLQTARMFELWAATKLARQWCDQHLRRVHRELDTADLKAANALLVQLGA